MQIEKKQTTSIQKRKCKITRKYPRRRGSDGCWHFKCCTETPQKHILYAIEKTKIKLHNKIAPRISRKTVVPSPDTKPNTPFPDYKSILVSV